MVGWLLYDLSVGMKGYGLIRKGRQGRREEDVALCVNDQLERTEFHLGTGEELTESLWSRIKGRSGIGDNVMEVCCRPPHQED